MWPLFDPFANKKIKDAKKDEDDYVEAELVNNGLIGHNMTKITLHLGLRKAITRQNF